jgi:HPt (histidine-containing phosphotransfer) domain-containing protein
MIKLKNILNEGSLTNYYKNYDAPTRSAAKKVDAALQNLIKDKKELDNVVDLITDLVDEYATERVDSYSSERY